MQWKIKLRRLFTVKSLFAAMLFFGRHLWEWSISIIDYVGRADFIRDTFPSFGTWLEGLHPPTAPMLTPIMVALGFFWLGFLIFWPDFHTWLSGRVLTLELPTEPLELTSWNKHIPAIFAHVLPRATEHLSNCNGYIDRIWIGTGRERRATTIQNPLTLKWAFRGFDPQDITPSIRLFLDVFHINERPTLNNFGIPEVGHIIQFEVPEGIPNSAAHIFDNGGTFQFDLRIVGWSDDGNYHEAVLSLGVRTDPLDWNSPDVWLIEEEAE